MEVIKVGEYEAPEMEMIEVLVEVGFNGSIWLEDGTGGNADVVTPIV